jgi:hypothetical protein
VIFVNHVSLLTFPILLGDNEQKTQ